MISLAALGGSGHQFWFLNQKPVMRVMSGQSATIALPSPGSYQLAVLDESGSSDMVQFEVISSAD